MNPIHPALAPLARAAKEMPYHDVAPVLKQALADRSWLRAEHRVGDPTRYMRHLLYVDPDDDFVITAIIWLPGQKSPVHGHYVWCAFGVVEGELTEETFRAPGDLLELVGSRLIRTAELADIDLGGPMYHRVSNQTQKPLVTLHAYGVAADRLTTGINRFYAEA